MRWVGRGVWWLVCRGSGEVGGYIGWKKGEGFGGEGCIVGEIVKGECFEIGGREAERVGECRMAASKVWGFWGLDAIMCDPSVLDGFALQSSHTAV